MSGFSLQNFSECFKCSLLRKVATGARWIMCFYWVRLTLVHVFQVMLKSKWQFLCIQCWWKAPVREELLVWGAQLSSLCITEKRPQLLQLHRSVADPNSSQLSSPNLCGWWKVLHGVSVGIGLLFKNTVYLVIFPLYWWIFGPPSKTHLCLACCACWYAYKKGNGNLSFPTKAVLLQQSSCEYMPPVLHQQQDGF